MQQQAELKHREDRNFVQTPILQRKFCLFEKVSMLNCAELLYHVKYNPGFKCPEPPCNIVYSLLYIDEVL